MNRHMKRDRQRTGKDCELACYYQRTEEKRSGTHDKEAHTRTLREPRDGIQLSVRVGDSTSGPKIAHSSNRIQSDQGSTPCCVQDCCRYIAISFLVKAVHAVTFAASVFF